MLIGHWGKKAQKGMEAMWSVPKLKFTHLVETFVDLYVEQSDGSVLKLTHLTEAIRQFCSPRNVWVHGNPMLETSPAQDDRQLSGIVQSMTDRLLREKFGVSYHKGQQWIGVRLSNPCLTVSQDRLVVITPERLSLMNSLGCLQVLTEFGWSSRGPREAKGLLGKGTFGAVYTGWLDGRTIAIKFFFGDSAADSAAKEARMRLKLEGSVAIVELLGGCVHHIKPQPEAVRAAPEQISYLVYERCSGNLNVAKNYSMAEKLGLLTDIIGGAVSLHSRAVVHRDLRVANILIKHCSISGRPKALLADFGIATNSDGIGRAMDEEAGRERTKRHYWMPSESMTNEEGVWTDVYAISFLVAYMFVPNNVVLLELKSPPATAAGRAWKGVINWINAARAPEVVKREVVSLLHLAHALLKARRSKYSIPPVGTFETVSPVVPVEPAKVDPDMQAQPAKRPKFVAARNLPFLPIPMRREATRGERFLIKQSKIN
jgi:hypothetical protein